jgi:hypothetical protein
MSCYHLWTEKSDEYPVLHLAQRQVPCPCSNGDTMYEVLQNIHGEAPPLTSSTNTRSLLPKSTIQPSPTQWRA